MLVLSGFMIIQAMVLQRRIRKKTVGGSEGSGEKTGMDPRQALPRNGPRGSIKQRWGAMIEAQEERKSGALSNSSSA